MIDRNKAKYYSTLTAEEKDVLEKGHTEIPFSGSLLTETREGYYLCKACGNKIFDSKTKFNSNCGWPSFDNALKNSVLETVDLSHNMQRIEITCANCHAHLGHVFNDGPKETTGIRYCINSISLNFKNKKI